MATNEYAGNSRLQRLRGSDFEVADGQPDIRGWDVKDTAGKKLGTVKDLIFDVESLSVRYMVVDLDDNDYELDDRKVLIPIGFGELHYKGDEVIMPGITVEQLAALPEYNNTITNEDEYAVRNVFAGADATTLTTTTPGTDFYNHEYYNMENLYRRRNAPMTDEGISEAITTDTDTTATPLANTEPATTTDAGEATAERTTIPVIEENINVGKRTVQTGGAYIRSRVVEKPIEETVNLREEHVRIERNPVDRPATSTDFDTFKEGVIELTEFAEVPVVNKEARVVEEITVSKDVTERSETIRDTVRKTEVDVEHLDNTTDTYGNNDRRDI